METVEEVMQRTGMAKWIREIKAAKSDEEIEAVLKEVYEDGYNEHKYCG